MELSIGPLCQHVTWKIRDFFELPTDIGYSIDSPEIRFAGDSYCLRLYPNGDRMYPDGTRTQIELKRLTSTFHKRNVSFEVGYRWINEERDEFDTYIPILTNIVFYPRSVIEEDRYKFYPDGTFIVLCSMRLGEQSNSESTQSEEPKTCDTDTEKEGLSGVDELHSNYRQLLQKGADSDACIVVSGKEFRAHRCILRVRSAVFEAMFGHETAEKESGRVVIDDLDPEIFGEFLEYLYTGSIGEGISDDNAFGLYAAADKYEVDTLKSVCVAYMRRNLSVDSFCDIMTMSLRHREEDLLQRAIEFFKENLPRIILTVKWQQFLTHNSTSANELLIKALVPEGQ